MYKAVEAIKPAAARNTGVRQTPLDVCFFYPLPPFLKASFRKLERLVVIGQSLPLNISPEGES